MTSLPRTSAVVMVVEAIVFVDEEADRAPRVCSGQTDSASQAACSDIQPSLFFTLIPVTDPEPRPEKRLLSDQSAPPLIE